MKRCVLKRLFLRDRLRFAVIHGSVGELS
jgi:hypothetical protein